MSRWQLAAMVLILTGQTMAASQGVDADGVPPLAPLLTLARRTPEGLVFLEPSGVENRVALARAWHARSRLGPINADLSNAMTAHLSQPLPPADDEPTRRLEIAVLIGPELGSFAEEQLATAAMRREAEILHGATDLTFGDLLIARLTDRLNPEPASAAWSVRRHQHAIACSGFAKSLSEGNVIDAATWEELSAARGVCVHRDALRPLLDREPRNSFELEAQASLARGRSANVARRARQHLSAIDRQLRDGSFTGTWDDITTTVEALGEPGDYPYVARHLEWQIFAAGSLPDIQIATPRSLALAAALAPYVFGRRPCGPPLPPPVLLKAPDPLPAAYRRAKIQCDETSRSGSLATISMACANRFDCPNRSRFGWHGAHMVRLVNKSLPHPRVASALPKGRRMASAERSVGKRFPSDGPIGASVSYLSTQVTE